MKLNIICVILIGVLFFILGWIFPVEGPIDYVYDDYASRPAHKQPVAPAPKDAVKEEVKVESIEDYCDAAAPNDTWFLYVYCRTLRTLD